MSQEIPVKKLSVKIKIAIGLAVAITPFLVAFIIAGMAGVSAVADFITYQILGMSWLSSIVASMLSSLFGADFISTWQGGAIHFFIYDMIKIIILLCTLIFLITYIQSFFPPEKTKRILSKFGGIKGNIMGAFLGTLTPFCNCSSIPIFMGFTRAGIRSGVTFSFLISSPLVDLGAFILLASIFGFKIAIAYVVVGLILAVIGGTIIEKSGVGNEVEDYILTAELQELADDTMTTSERLAHAKKITIATLKYVFPYIAIGVGIGSAIHNIIPESVISAVLGENNPFSVLIATVVGTPMYADIFGAIPIAEALFYKGVGLGTVLAFMMSVTALSLPSMIILKKAVKPKLLGSFIAIVVIGIIIIGYAFNAFGYIFI